MNASAELSNYLINKLNFRSYLELGLGIEAPTFNLVNAHYKRGVDVVRPRTQCLGNFSEMTTDEYFDSDVHDDLRIVGKFDLIYIDASHDHKNVDKDFENSLKCLSKNGIILMDDIFPPAEDWQEMPRTKRTPGHCGDCWKSFLKLRCTRKDLSMYTVKFDNNWCANGIVWYGGQELFHDGVLDEFLEYSYFENNTDNILNFINDEELDNILDKRFK